MQLAGDAHSHICVFCVCMCVNLYMNSPCLCMCECCDSKHLSKAFAVNVPSVLITTDEDGNIIIKRFLLLTNTHSLISTYLFSWQSEWPWITFRTLEDGINNCVYCMLHMKHTIDTEKHKKSQAFELKDKVSMFTFSQLQCLHAGIQQV